MIIQLVLHPDQLTKIDHDGLLLRLTVESDKNGIFTVIRIDGDPDITHGFRLESGKHPTFISLREF